MKAVIQRVSSAKVEVAGQTSGEIGRGLLILLGVKESDTEKEARWLADKCLNLRIFEDAKGLMNLSVLETQGEVMVVSQFTLYGATEKGRRPSFTQAAPPSLSEPLYQYFIGLCRNSGLRVASGVFGADMQVSLVNDGPVTLIAEKNSHSD